jgi:hypothetical protein
MAPPTSSIESPNEHGRRKLSWVPRTGQVTLILPTIRQLRLRLPRIVASRMGQTPGALEGDDTRINQPTSDEKSFRLSRLRYH